MSIDALPPPPTSLRPAVAGLRRVERLRRAREALNRCLLRQPAFVPQSRDYGESRGFGGPGKRYNGIIRIMLCKSSIAYAVLIDICSPVNRAVNTDAIQWRTWRRCDVLVRLGPGSKRGCKKSCAIHQLIGVSAICCALGDFPCGTLGLCHALSPPRPRRS
jgi:hypothetical protein